MRIIIFQKWYLHYFETQDYLTILEVRSQYLSVAAELVEVESRHQRELEVARADIGTRLASEASRLQRPGEVSSDTQQRQTFPRLYMQAGSGATAGFPRSRGGALAWGVSGRQAC